MRALDLEDLEGAEEVLECAECGTRSTNDLRGRQGWALVLRRPYGSVHHCPECAPLGVRGCPATYPAPLRFPALGAYDLDSRRARRCRSDES